MRIILPSVALALIAGCIEPQGGAPSSSASLAHSSPLTLQINALMLEEGGWAVVSTSNLLAMDEEDGTGQISYEVTASPATGLLSRAMFTQVDINAGDVSYQHDGSEAPEDSFSFHVTNSAGQTLDGSLSFILIPVNDAPLAGAERMAVDEGGEVVLSGLWGSDPDNGATDLHWSVEVAPAHGVIAPAWFTQAELEAGAVTYTHDGSEAPHDTAQMVLTDASGASTTVALGFDVIQVNDPPRVLSATLTVSEAGQTALEGLAVEDPEGEPLELVVTAPPTHGSLSALRFSSHQLAMGTVRYEHDGSEFLSDSFGLQVSDPSGGQTQVVVSVEVLPQNDPPLASATLAMVDEGGSLRVTESLLQANDPDDAPAQLHWTVTAGPEHGGLSLTRFSQRDVLNGALRYIHDGSEGPRDTIDLELEDASGARSLTQLVIDVHGVADPPSATSSPLWVEEGARATVSLLATDPDSAVATLTWSLVVPPLHGKVTPSSFSQAQVAAGQVVYQHDGGESSSDSFVARVTDPSGLFVDATVPVQITPQNDPPVVSVTGFWVEEGGEAVVSGVSATDPDGDALTWSVVGDPVHGEVEPMVFDDQTLRAGQVRYRHDGSESSADHLELLVRDARGLAMAVTLPLHITPRNDAPVLTAVPLTVVEGEEAVVSGIVALDPDDPPGSLMFELLEWPQTGWLSPERFSQADLDAGRVSFLHSGGELSADRFRLLVRDSAGASDTQMVEVRVSAVDDLPTVAVPQLVVAEGGMTTLAGLEVRDPDGVELVWSVVQAPRYGALSATSFGADQVRKVTYTHAGLQHGLDAFQLELNDGTRVMIEVSIELVNDPPIAADDGVYEAQAGVPLVVSAAEGLLANDYDEEGATLHATLMQAPALGAVALTADGGFLYTAEAPGDDSFSYVISDGAQRSLEATVSLSVRPAAVTIDTAEASLDTGSTQVMDGVNDLSPQAACGCATAGRGGVAWLLGLLVLGARRRS